VFVQAGMYYPSRARTFSNAVLQRAKPNCNSLIFDISTFFIQGLFVSFNAALTAYCNFQKQHETHTFSSK